MGLFDFFRKKQKDPQGNTSYDSSGVVSTPVLGSDDSSAEHGAFESGTADTATSTDGGGGGGGDGGGS